MKFQRTGDSPLSQAALVYRPEEYSFVVEPKPESGVASLLLDDLQLEIDLQGHLLYPWGLCSHTTWRPMTAIPPRYVQGSVSAGIEREITPGISWRLPHPGRWLVFVNRQAGWVCVGDPLAKDGSEAIEFSPGCVIVLSRDQPVALWLRPNTLPSR